MTGLDAYNLLLNLSALKFRATLFDGLVALAKEMHGLSEFDAVEYVTEQLHEIVEGK